MNFDENLTVVLGVKVRMERRRREGREFSTYFHFHWECGSW
jgi:hypothetical protein